MINCHQFQINLPNGAALKWKRPHDMGNQSLWFRKDFHATDTSFNEPNKLKRPLLGGFSAADSGQVMAIYDWDRSHMPEGMSEDELWSGAYDVGERLGGVVFRSASGMPKVAVVLESNGAPKAPQLRAGMEALFGVAESPQMNWWDRVDSAQRQTFLDLASAVELGENLWNAGVWRLDELAAPVGTEDAIGQYIVTPKCQNDTYLETPLQVLEFTAAENDILLVLQNLPGLVRPQGWHLSVKWVAKQAKLAHTTVSRAMRSLGEKGLLRCINKHFIPGAYGKLYQAYGALYDAIEARIARKVMKKALPQRLEDGNSFSQLRDATWHFDNLHDYMAWVMMVQPVNQRERWEKAESIARSHYRSR